MVCQLIAALVDSPVEGYHASAELLGCKLLLLGLQGRLIHAQRI
jgi:hypothetical protein